MHGAAQESRQARREGIGAPLNFVHSFSDNIRFESLDEVEDLHGHGRPARASRFSPMAGSSCNQLTLILKDVTLYT